MKLLTSTQMRELEQRADAEGNAYAQMMERAGALTAKAMLQRWTLHDRRVLVLVGPGNNGGDGLVCARVLHEAGATVGLYLWKREIRDDDVNWRLCLERDINHARAEEDDDLAQLKRGVASADFIVDALLGTGVARPIEGVLKDLLAVVRTELAQAPAAPDLVSPARAVSMSWGTTGARPEHTQGGETRLRATAPPLHARQGERSPVVVAVDLPTGLNPDTGALDPAAVPADLTVTFAFPKVGHYLFPGADAVGELAVADIGIPQDWAKDIPLDVATGEEVASLLPQRPRNSNKGTYGKALLACGSLEYTGAPALAAQAAGRVGAGLVTLALPRTIHPIVAARLQDPTFFPVVDQNGAWVPDAVDPLVEQARGYDALLLGCGFGRAPTTQMFVKELLGVPPEEPQELPPLVVDADALNALAQVPGWWKHAQTLTRPGGAPPVLTPHPGEMARLLGGTVADVQKDRLATARTAAQTWNAIVVLKGAFTVIAAPDGRATIIPFANPALATAGTGDVLGGAIVGLLAQYGAAGKDERRKTNDEGRTNDERLKTNDDAGKLMEDSYRAAVVGAYLHGLAGELTAAEIGRAGAVAGDVVMELPRAIGSLA